MVHNLLRKGSFELADHTGTPQAGRLEQLHGMLTFIDSIDLHARYIAFVNSEKRNALHTPTKSLTVADFGKKATDHIAKLTPGELLFQRFLFYKEFYGATRPVIVCEGKTDNLYLLHAIHSLAHQFPSLASPPAAGKPSKLKVRLFKYVDTRAGRVLELGDGGGGILAKLLESYVRITKKFLAPVSAQPCIILVDNDSGSSAVNSALKKLKVAAPPGASFMYVRGNLYVMRTPPLPGKPTTEIEDFFDVKTKAIKWEGKSFNPVKDADSTLHYDKKTFAYHVVRPNAKTIDFSGFTPILETFVGIQKHYAMLLSTGGVITGATP
jgi:RNA-directed DNA polymerase